MATSFPAQDEAEAMVDFLYGALLHRQAATAADREHWVSIAQSAGLWGLVDQFVTNPDIVAEQTVINQLIADYQAGKLGGSAPTSVPAHTHTVTVSGTSGGPQ